MGCFDTKGFIMIKKSIVCLGFIFSSSTMLAAQAVDLYKAPLQSISQFPLVSNKPKLTAARQSTQGDQLQELTQTQEDNKTVTRYQQLYKGIPVVGAQIMVSKVANQSSNANAEVNGHLIQDIQLNTTPAITTAQAMDIAKKSYFSTSPEAETKEESVQLEIRSVKDDELVLVYLVSFRSVDAENKPVWPFFVINAQTGAISKQWNNIKTLMDVGPGGNEKVHEYWYGKDGLPGLDVTENNGQCTMDNDRVRLVSLNSEWDFANTYLTPFSYPCYSNAEENINGAFSPRNDAYFFGHVIVNMYKNWYGMNALQLANGKPMKLIMRVHFGQNFDNAFWDGEAMSFGDGTDFYPLVSLDVAGHEVTHGFTEQHSGLEYHDQSGALNESISDMAGQTARAYLLEENPQLYNKAYLTPNEVTWGIGETITREVIGKALRFMDIPSSDGSSADCLDKSLAQSHGIFCAIDYSDVVAFANTHFANPRDRQNYIVHTGSGVFNKAFYLLSKQLGIKKAYEIMMIANTKYWTPTTDFKKGACGVIHAANDLKINRNDVMTIFGQVGIDVSGCAL